MDLIRLNDLTLDALIGVHPHERTRPQPLLINLEIKADLHPGTQTDRVEDTLSYEDLYTEVCALVRRSEFALLEALAEAIAECCLAHPRALAVRVRIEKPGIFEHVRSAGIELRRRKKTEHGSQRHGGSRARGLADDQGRG